MSMDAYGYFTEVADSDYSGWSSDESWAEFDAYFNAPFYRAEAVKCEDIFEAAAKGNVREVRHFLREDPDSVKAEGPIGDEPLLHLAARYGHVAVVEVLLDAGASVDAKDDTFGWTPLHWAATNGHDAVVERLLAAGASVDAVNNGGQTPLHWAAEKCRDATVLLAAGANIDATDNEGWTPLHWAATNGHDAVVERLLAAGAAVDAVDNGGRTPLHCAAKEGRDAVVERLLAAGASVYAVDNDGMTPYQLAHSRGHAMVLGWLKPVTVHLGFGGEKLCRCNSYRYKTFNGLMDKVEKDFGVKIRALVGPKGELLFDASDADSWKLSPWESKIDIDNGDEITAIVDNPQQERESDD